MRTKLTLVATGLAFSGCTFLPVANYNRETVIQEAIDKKDHLLGKDRKLNLENARFLAVGWRDRLESAAVTKRNQTLVAEEVLYYGTLLLTGAQTALATKNIGGMERDLRHIRNIAGFSALGSTLFSEHYNTGDQQPMFEKAAARMRCVTDLLADVQEDVPAQWSDEDFMALKRKDDDRTPIFKLYQDIPRQVVEFVERKSVPDLRAALSSITVGTPTRAELIQTIQQYTKEQKSASDALPDQLALTRANKDKRSQSQADVEAQTKFLVAVSSFSSSLQACAVTYTQ